VADVPETPASTATPDPTPPPAPTVAPGGVHRLADATWTEIHEIIHRAPRVIALVPVGATEAHGPHLPLATDVIIAEGTVRRAAAALAAKGHEIVIAPALAYSVTHYAGGFAGTAGVGEASARAYVRDVCTGLGHAGFVRVVLVNAHLEPAHVAVLRGAAADATQGLLRVAFADKTEKRFARTLTDEYKRGECHAGSYETSLVLAERPELVRNAARMALPPVPINLAHAMKAGKKTFVESGADSAYFGNPAGATVEEGEWIYARLVEMVVTVVEETWASA
jgi:creatinine amidohydrolase